MTTPRNVADSVLARRSGDLRVLIRIGARGWPELDGKVLVYLLDGADESKGEVPVYLPDVDEWITVSLETIGTRTPLTGKASHAQTDRARESVEFALNTKVRVVRTRGGQGGK